MLIESDTLARPNATLQGGTGHSGGPPPIHVGAPVVTIASAPAPLSEERLPAVLAIRDWLLEAGRGGGALTDLLKELAHRLRREGEIPVDRLTLALQTLHAEQRGHGVFWTSDRDADEQVFPYSPGSDAIYAASPFAYAHEHKSWLLLWVPETPDETFGIVPELKAEGYRHYLCAPVLFLNGAANGVTVSTKSPGGFSADDLAFFGELLPTLAMVMELAVTRRMLDEVVSTYVGDEPRRRILAGEVRRGQVTLIRSAIFFADMRGFTALSMRLSEEEISALLNTYFDCLVPAIEEQGGEVLKYIGDGILAIFRDRSDDFGGAATGALAAARQAVKNVEALNRSDMAANPIDFGIALHHGSAGYGNIGSGTRLDFTVIGRDVNLASRIGRLCAELNRRLLVSRAFAEQLWEPLEEVGEFELPGVPEPQRVFASAGI